MADRKALVIVSGSTSQIPNADTLIVGSGITTAAGSLTLGSFADSIIFAANEAITAAAGTGSFDLSNASGIFRTTTGAVTVGPGAVTVSGATTYTAAGTAITVNNNAAITGTLTSTGAIYANGGLDRSTAAALNIGTTNATVVNIGAVGVQTNILGDLSVAGAVNTVGGTTFSTDATFEGNVTFGDAATDTVAFISRVGPVGNQDLHFLKELAHVIDVDASTTAATAGGSLSIKAGNGNGAVGGTLNLNAGTGTTAGDINIGTTAGANITIGVASSLNLTSTDAVVNAASYAEFSVTGSSGFFIDSGTSKLDVELPAGWQMRFIGGGNQLIWDRNAATFTLQAGSVLQTTGSGNINLPNNGSARFQVEGTSVGSTVTAPNLDTLTNGSNADALHTHTGISSVGVTVTVTTGEAIDAGEVVVIRDDTGTPGTPKAYKADNDDSAKNFGVVGLAGASVGSGASLTVYLSGERSVADAEFDAVPATTNVGQPVYMSATAGNMTLTAPTASGSVLQKIGIVSRGGSGAVKVVIQVHDRIEL